MVDFTKLFSPTQKNAPTNNNPNPNQQQQNQQQQETNPDGTPKVAMKTGNPAIDNAEDPNKAKNPLDAFNGIFDNKPNSEDKAPSFALPADKLKGVADGLDFTDGIDQELFTKATSGDSTSMIQLMNAIARNAYQTALTHGSTLTENWSNSRLEYEGKSLGSKVKGELTNAELRNVNGSNHPVVQQQMQQLAGLFQTQFPDASPQEIVAKTKEYITSLSSAINPAAETDANGNKPEIQVDWDALLSKRS